MHKKFLISVIVPTYNRTKYICTALESILSQTYPNYEIIVVDDGSEKETQRVLEKYAGKIKYIYQKHAGLSAALNTGLKNSSGELIGFLDDDDLWADRLFEEVYQIFADSDTDIVFFDRRFLKDNLKRELLDLNPVPEEFLSDFESTAILEKLFERNFIPINTAIVKRKCFDEVGLFDVSLKTCMDWDIWIKMSYAGLKFRYSNKVLAFIRVHEDQMSKDRISMILGEVKVLEKAERNSPKIKKESAILLSERISDLYFQVGVMLMDKGSKMKSRYYLLKSLKRKFPRDLRYYIKLLAGFK